MPSYKLVASRDGDIIDTSFDAEDEESAQIEATRLICALFHLDGGYYEEWWELTADLDGCRLEECEPMAERIPLDTMQAYRRLADGLRDMIDGERLTADVIPDDFAWLSKTLATLSLADPGDAALPAHMRGEPA